MCVFVGSFLKEVHMMDQTADFFRQKAAQCREIAERAEDTGATVRALEAMALELDACALAIEAGVATSRAIEPNGHDSEVGARPN